jgi:hypothetical protein
MGAACRNFDVPDVFGWLDFDTGKENDILFSMTANHLPRIEPAEI